MVATNTMSKNDMITQLLANIRKSNPNVDEEDISVKVKIIGDDKEYDLQSLIVSIDTEKH